MLAALFIQKAAVSVPCYLQNCSHQNYSASRGFLRGGVMIKGFPFYLNVQLFDGVAISARKAGVYMLILKTGKKRH